MSFLLSMQETKARINDGELKPLDCRFVLGQPEAGLAAFEQAHLPGAVHLDLEKDLSAPVTIESGRHPQPNRAKTAEKLGKYGISSDEAVVVYDDQNLAMAARAWWVLRYLGHRHVYVMNASFSDWVAAGLPVEREARKDAPVNYELREPLEQPVSADDIEREHEDQEVVLIDARTPERYQGEDEPIDQVAGHIPGAVNEPFLQMLTDRGRLLDAASLKKQLQHRQDQKLMNYCGSGVTACVNVLAQREAGLEDVYLYPGSWSEWIALQKHQGSK
ncbi:thiosulfate/3-mercaptopyruvate sulfurtransferase [Salsuginibacillus halophilus]|uniref:Sulfurtransferase n=1 Tax=Salsuginibacillus halophilus TaxID=517424 RepID=A0A2P8HWE6_9BACI|nr:sulfurtransferase [Salsuginibacillus halophilus]PSL50546.1 thiosulfate/3-mercaptopyruvate sulfurtransferase [Salsuginibacillus halophilus]